LSGPFTAAGVQYTISGYPSSYTYESFVPGTGFFNLTTFGADTLNRSVYLPFDINSNGCPHLLSVKQEVSSYSRIERKADDGFVVNSYDTQRITTLFEDNFVLGEYTVIGGESRTNNFESSDPRNEPEEFSVRADRLDSLGGEGFSWNVCEDLLDGLLKTKIIRFSSTEPISPYPVTGTLFDVNVTAQLILTP
jgi:hypothetical protein